MYGGIKSGILGIHVYARIKWDTKIHSTHHLLPDIWAFLKKVVCNTIGCVHNSTNWKREIINSCCALRLLVVHFIIWVLFCCFVYVIMTTYIFWRFWLVCLVWMFVLNLMSLFCGIPGYYGPTEIFGYIMMKTTIENY